MRELELLDLIPKETALIVMDMQNGFIRLEGSIGRTGASMELQQAAVAPVGLLVETCRDAGILDIWMLQEHYPDDAALSRHRIKPLSARRGGPPALIHTWDAEIVDELKPLFASAPEVVRRHRFSAFFDTRLDTLLRMKGIRYLIICGASTPLSVGTTTIDAYQRDYDVVVAKDAIGISSPEFHEHSFKVLDAYFGRCMNTTDIIRSIAASVAPEVASEIA